MRSPLSDPNEWVELPLLRGASRTLWLGPRHLAPLEASQYYVVSGLSRFANDVEDPLGVGLSESLDTVLSN